MEFFGWLKLRTKAATTGISNLAPHESGVNAAEWCSTVDLVEKKLKFGVVFRRLNHQ